MGEADMSEDMAEMVSRKIECDRVIRVALSKEKLEALLNDTKTTGVIDLPLCIGVVLTRADDVTVG